MQLAEYQTASRETALYPDRDSNLWYPALGLIGEYHEWQMATDDSNRLKEAGDVAWYCAQLCSELKADLASAIAQPRTTDSSALILMQLAEGVKKWHRDGGDDKKRHNILQAVAWIWQTAVQQSTETETAALLSANIQKLRDRKNRGVLQGSGDDR